MDFFLTPRTRSCSCTLQSSLKSQCLSARLLSMAFTVKILSLTNELPWTSLVTQTVRHLLTMWETLVRSLGWGDPLEKEMATHSSIPACRIPWTEEPGGLQSTGS